MQVSGAMQGTSSIPRRRRLNVLLAILAALAVAAVVAVLMWVVPPATTSGVGADDARPNAGAGSAIVHDDAGNVNAGAAVVQAGGHDAGYYPLPHGKVADTNAGAGSAIVHDDAGNVRPDAGSAIVHDDAGSVNR